MVDRSPLNIVVLAGGDSAERSVSLESGQAVTQALSGRGHHVTQIDPASTSLTELHWNGVDAVFLALHGPFGEDGQVQSMLNENGVPYTGSDAAVSRTAFSKSASKEQFLSHGIPTPRYVLVHHTDSIATIEAHAEAIGFPLVVKPDGQGSSVGVSIVRSDDQLGSALDLCFEFDNCGLIETAIQGTEWTVGVVDEVVLPAIQIETPHEYFDYTAKYQSDETQYLFDVDMDRSVVESIETTAKSTCRALGTRGIARVDLRLDQELQPWVLEVNTIPGFTSHSLIPKAAARHGIAAGELYEQAVLSCLSATIAQPQTP